MTAELELELLGAGHRKEVVRPVLAQLARGRAAELDPEQLAQHHACSREEVLCLLRALEDKHVVSCERTYVCPECDVRMSPLEYEAGECPSCPAVFSELAKPPRAEQAYVTALPHSTDLSWAIVVHGMWSRGTWQEELSWCIALLYRRSAPVHIYKYGRVGAGALLPCLQKLHQRRLARRIREAQREAVKRGFSKQPDVIAHSFGTWLVGQALLADRELKVGRVILCGSILRPDFAWGTLVNRGQVDAVLNHYSHRDFLCRIAQYFIPDSGPSGRVGFLRGLPVNARELDYSHAAYFSPDHLATQFDGLWRDFLTAPVANLRYLVPDHPTQNWTPGPRILWLCARLLICLVALPTAILLPLYLGWIEFLEIEPRYQRWS